MDERGGEGRHVKDDDEGSDEAPASRMSTNYSMADERRNSQKRYQNHQQHHSSTKTRRQQLRSSRSNPEKAVLAAAAVVVSSRNLNFVSPVIRSISSGGGGAGGGCDSSSNHSSSSSSPSSPPINASREQARDLAQCLKSGKNSQSIIERIETVRDRTFLICDSEYRTALRMWVDRIVDEVLLCGEQQFQDDRRALAPITHTTAASGSDIVVEEFSGAQWQAQALFSVQEAIEITHLLMQYHPESSIQPDRQGQTPLMKLLRCRSSFTVLTQDFLSNGRPCEEVDCVDVEDTNDDDGTVVDEYLRPMIQVLIRHHPPCVTTFKCSSFGCTALHYAILHKHPLRTVRAILQAAPLSALEENNLGETPLHIAATLMSSFCFPSYSSPSYHQLLSAMHCLLEYAPEAASMEDRGGRTPLHWLWIRYVSDFATWQCSTSSNEGPLPNSASGTAHHNTSSTHGITAVTARGTSAAPNTPQHTNNRRFIPNDWMKLQQSCVREIKASLATAGSTPETLLHRVGENGDDDHTCVCEKRPTLDLHLPRHFRSFWRIVRFFFSASEAHHHQEQQQQWQETRRQNGGSPSRPHLRRPHSPTKVDLRDDPHCASQLLSTAALTPCPRALVHIATLLHPEQCQPSPPSSSSLSSDQKVLSCKRGSRIPLHVAAGAPAALLGGMPIHKDYRSRGNTTAPTTRTTHHAAPFVLPRRRSRWKLDQYAPTVVQILLNAQRRAARARDENGRLPLHIAIDSYKITQSATVMTTTGSSTHAFSTTTLPSSGTHQRKSSSQPNLLGASCSSWKYDEAGASDASPPTPTVIAKYNNWDDDCDLMKIMKAYPEALGLQDDDKFGGLFPFMLAACGAQASIDLAFHLLREGPENVQHAVAAQQTVEAVGDDGEVEGIDAFPTSGSASGAVDDDGCACDVSANDSDNDSDDVLSCDTAGAVAARPVPRRNSNGQKIIDRMTPSLGRTQDACLCIELGMTVGGELQQHPSKHRRANSPVSTAEELLFASGHGHHHDENHHHHHHHHQRFGEKRQRMR